VRSRELLVGLTESKGRSLERDVPYPNRRLKGKGLYVAQIAGFKKKIFLTMQALSRDCLLFFLKKRSAPQVTIFLPELSLKRVNVKGL